MYNAYNIEIVRVVSFFHHFNRMIYVRQCWNRLKISFHIKKIYNVLSLAPNRSEHGRYKMKWRRIVNSYNKSSRDRVGVCVINRFIFIQKQIGSWILYSVNLCTKYWLHIKMLPLKRMFIRSVYDDYSLHFAVQKLLSIFMDYSTSLFFLCASKTLMIDENRHHNCSNASFLFMHDWHCHQQFEFKTAAVLVCFLLICVFFHSFHFV